MGMKAVSVLKTVRVADGSNVHGREIVKDTEDEIPEELFDGLRADGYVEAASPKKGGSKKKAVDDDAAKRDAILADLVGLSDDDLAGIVKAEKIDVADTDDRDAVVGKIADARLASKV